MIPTTLNKDTKVCLSLSARPSNFGTRFHNYLYNKLGLDFLYKAVAISDIEGAIKGIRALGFRGCAVSMPFKQTAVAYIDGLDEAAEQIGAINTIVNSDGHLKGYNTDASSVSSLLESSLQQGFATCEMPVLIYGSGGMALAVLYALRKLGFKRISLKSRDPRAGTSIADKFGAQWYPDYVSISDAKFLVNATSIGMSPNEGSTPFDTATIKSADVIMDVVNSPIETVLTEAAKSLGKFVIDGGQIGLLQAAEQFRLYTGQEVLPADLEEANNWARLK